MDRELFIQPSVRIRNFEKKLLTKIQFESELKILAKETKSLALNVSDYYKEMLSNFEIYPCCLFPQFAL